MLRYLSEGEKKMMMREAEVADGQTLCSALVPTDKSLLFLQGKDQLLP